MKKNETLNKYNISDTTLRNWNKLNYIENINNVKEEEIENVIKNKIGIRRNKKNSIDNIIPISYIDDKNIIPIIKRILELKEKYDVSNNEILHETVIYLLNKRKLEIPNEVQQILKERNTNLEFLKEFKRIKIKYEDDNDFLGCLYMSLISIGKKDMNGIYYTPYKVVDKIVSSVDFKKNKLIVDPGCGSGNFLIQVFKKMKSNGITISSIINNLYGFDEDEVAVLLAKINIYLLNKRVDFNKINIYKKDFLNDNINKKFDIVIGNPPWGKKYTLNERKKFKEKFGVVFSKMDSFGQFIVRSFEVMNDGGILGFVLPSSILNIATHENIRKVLLNNKIVYIKTIGREFDEIVTDVIIIKVQKSCTTNNTCIYNDATVDQNDFIKNPYYNFLIKDFLSKNILNKVKNFNSFHLVDNVDYALGIVTGDNNKFVTQTKTNDNEYIISGKDIDKYNIDYSKIQNYITFKKENFQQVANEKFYRNKNKIIYKFISKKLCFAAEQKGTLTLNSANVICLPEQYDLYYITAILNSRITQLYFEDTYNTHKVLKNHIQSFYIPNFEEYTVKQISEICKNIEKSNTYCEEIENIIYEKLQLTIEEIEYLKNRFN